MNPTNRRFIILNFVGGAFLLVGVVIGLAVLLDYFQIKGGTIHFDAQSKFQDLGTVLSGTAGLMFTIAGVLFFTYTLYQTSSEMRQTQNILSAQLSESTFFNLVKHHKDTYTDNEKVYSAFVGEVDKMFSKFEMFEEELNDCFFYIKTTRWQPNSILIEFNQIKNFSDSILHIIRYINHSLRHNVHFYHETLYNNLSSYERIIIGMLIKHRVEKIDMNKFDDYVNAYIVKRPQVVLSDLEFPSLSSTLEDFYKKQIVIPNLDNIDEALSILEKETTFYFQLPPNCKLIGILAYINAPSWESPNPLLYHDSQGDGKFDLLPVFKTGILNDINNKESVRIRIVFRFEYNNKTFKVQLCEYSITKGLRMQFTLPETGKATERVKTNALDYISFEQVVHNELG